MIILLEHCITMQHLFSKRWKKWGDFSSLLPQVR